MAVSPKDIGLEKIEDSIARIRALLQPIRDARRKIARGRGPDADSGERRVKAELRQMTMDRLEAEADTPLIVTPGFGTEAHIGERNNILSGEFLEIGILAARAVCKISRGVTTGTGFLVGEGVVLTNHHVIEEAGHAREALFEFLYDDNTIGTPRNSVAYVADTDRFFYSDEDLDFCFVALRQTDGSPALGSFGWLPLLPDEGKILIGHPVNIIQHPNGLQKRVVVHDSTFTMIRNGGELDPYCWYSGDTESGSSGAPVMNSRWEAIALHHKAVPATDKNGHVLDVDGKLIAKERLDDPDTRVKWIANEGIRVSRIVGRLKAAALEGGYAEIRERLLQLWSSPLATIEARKASYAGMAGQI